MLDNREVLGHGEVGCKPDVLVHHPYSVIHCGKGRMQVHWSSPEQDFSLLRDLGPAEHLDQGGLARTVVTDQPVHRSSGKRQRDIVDGDDSRVGPSEGYRLEYWLSTLPGRHVVLPITNRFKPTAPIAIRPTITCCVNEDTPIRTRPLRRTPRKSAPATAP